MFCPVGVGIFDVCHLLFPFCTDYLVDHLLAHGSLQWDTLVEAFDCYCSDRFPPFVFIRRYAYAVCRNVCPITARRWRQHFSPRMWRFVRASAFLPKIPLYTCLLFMKSGLSFKSWSLLHVIHIITHAFCGLSLV